MDLFHITPVQLGLYEASPISSASQNCVDDLKLGIVLEGLLKNIRCN